MNKDDRFCLKAHLEIMKGPLPPEEKVKLSIKFLEAFLK